MYERNRRSALPPLPEEASPFVRELLLEICRRVPHTLGIPPSIEPGELRDAQGCRRGARALLAWLETVPDTVGQRVEELEVIFCSLLAVVREIDAKLHRAVLQARGWVEEEMAFSHAVHDVLGELRAALAGSPQHGAASELIAQILVRIAAKEDRDGGEAASLSSHFDRVQSDLALLRSEIVQVEARTRKLQEQSLRDSLTGLWNRRACDGRLAEEVCRAQRYAAPLSIVLWDVDCFKLVNDVHGHCAGDAVLQALARRAAGLLRRSDFLSRYGGEEFLVLLPNTTAAQAAAVAEKIRLAASAAAVETAEGGVAVTISAGVASFSPDDTAASLFERADRALYGAKAAGRNRVGTAREPGPVRAAS